MLFIFDLIMYYELGIIYSYMIIIWDHSKFWLYFGYSFYINCFTFC
jgi:hypothetical protein